MLTNVTVALRAFATAKSLANIDHVRNSDFDREGHVFHAPRADGPGAIERDCPLRLLLYERPLDCVVRGGVSGALDEAATLQLLH